jgi:hypothetical protein
MLKFKWKELPDGRKIEDYGFMDGASNLVYGWEFLRRHPGYRADYEAYRSIIDAAKAHVEKVMPYSKWTKIYFPPMIPEDEGNYRRWLHRVIFEGKVDPEIVYANEFYPQKWGLKRMAPYDQPYGDAIKFLPSSAVFPVLIRSEDAIEPFLEEMGGDGTAMVNAVSTDKAILVFDLKAPRVEQMREAKKILDGLFEENKKLYGVKRTSVPKRQTDELIRHLRILDLQRAHPSMTNADIAKAVGYDETVNGTSAYQQGQRYVQQAIYARNNYRFFLE